MKGRWLPEYWRLFVMKKILRKDIEKSLLEKIDELKEIIKNDSTFMNSPECMTIRFLLKEGENRTEIHCYNCGNVTEMDRNARKCPVCGNEHFIHDNGVVITSSYKFYAEKKDDVYYLVKYQIIYSMPEECNDAVDWFLHKPEKELQIKTVCMFDKEAGLFVMTEKYPAWKLLASSSLHYASVRSDIKNWVPNNKINFSMDDMIQEIEDFEDRQKEKKAQKKPGKAQLLLAMKENYKPRVINPEDLVFNDNILYREYSDDGIERSVVGHCLRCGYHGEIKVDQNARGTGVVCPDCGLQATTSNNYGYSRGNSCKKRNKVIVENTNLPNNDLLLRVFEVSDSLSKDYKVTHEIFEESRAFLDIKGITTFNRSNYGSETTPNKFVKESVIYLNSILDPRYHGSDYEPGSNNEYMVQSETEIAEIIENSCMARTGLTESFGFNPLYPGCYKFPHLTYLKAWYKNNDIELVLKAGNPKITEYFVDNIEHLQSGSTFAEVVGVPKPVARMVQKMQCDRTEMFDLLKLYDADPNITKEIFEKIKENKITIQTIIGIIKNYHLSYTQILNYLDSVYQHQCVDRSDSIGIWSDYLNMATYLHIDLKDKNRLYPTSLKKDHDVAVFAYNSMKTEIDEKMFADQAERNKELEYSYKDLIAVVPMRPQDVINEATKQRNCLRSYMDRIKKGETSVVFIRKKENPSESYLTAEVRDGELIQLRGYCNRIPRSNEIDEFIGHWMKAKHIINRC